MNGQRPSLVQQRVQLMDRLGIRRAVVSRLEGVLLKDSSVANQELHALIGGHERFFPAYTLNPTFPSWERELDRCRAEYGLAPGMGAIRLHPNYHGYRLDDPALEPCLRRLTDADLPVLLPLQLEDSRMHHPAIQVPDLPLQEVAALVGRWPQLRWVIASAIYHQVLSLGQRLAQQAPQARVWFELSRVQGPIDDVRLLRDALGIHRLLFGTNLPLLVAESPIMELADAHLPPDEDAAVRYGNARDALGVT